MPGVTAAGAVSYLPLATNVYMADAFKMDSGQTVQRIVTNAVTPGYFARWESAFSQATTLRPTFPEVRNHL